MFAPNENPWVSPFIINFTAFWSGCSLKYASSMLMLTGVVGYLGRGTKVLKAGFVLGFVWASPNWVRLFALSAGMGEAAVDDVAFLWPVEIFAGVV